jgi:hypothetical protein
VLRNYEAGEEMSDNVIVTIGGGESREHGETLGLTIENKDKGICSGIWGVSVKNEPFTSISISFEELHKIVSNMAEIMYNPNVPR